MRDSLEDSEMDDAINQITLETAFLYRLLDDLKYNRKLFSQQPSRLSVGVLIKKNLVDAQNCLAIVRKHQRNLRSLVSSSYEQGIIDKLGPGSCSQGISEEDAVDGEVYEDDGDYPSPSRGILDCCCLPQTLQDVNLILSTFDFVIKDHQSLTTVDFHSCELMLDRCKKCTEKYLEMCTNIITETSELLTATDEYIKAIFTEIGNQKKAKKPGGVSDKGGMELAIHISKTLHSVLDELTVLQEETADFQASLEETNKKIETKDHLAEELWTNGEIFEMHSYFTDESILCWVKADKKTMRRSMLSCDLTNPEELGTELDDGTSVIANIVTLSSKDGRALQAGETPITIFIPLEQENTSNEKETIVLTKTTKEETYKMTDYKIVTNMDRPCLQITRQELSWLVVVPAQRHIVHEEVIDSKGGTVQSPVDDTVKIGIAPGSLDGPANIGIQVIPEKELPIGRVRIDHGELVNASSMIYPKLPSELRKPAKIAMTVENHQEAEDAAVYAMVYSEQGWKSEPFETSSSASGSFSVNAKSGYKRVIVLTTTQSTDEEQAKELAMAISERINEQVVNCIVMQHSEDEMKLYIECCKREYGQRHVDEAKERGYVVLSRPEDVYLKNGAVITIRCSNEIAFHLPRNDRIIHMHFSPDLFRPVEVYVKPDVDGDQQRPRTALLRGYVEFVVSPKDVGPTELELRRYTDGADIVLQSMPITIKQEQIDGNAINDQELLFQLADSITHLLSKADLLQLAANLRLKASVIESMKQSLETFTLRNVLQRWYPKTRVADDKFTLLAQALKQIGKTDAAETLQNMNNTHDSLFLKIVRYLTEDYDVLKDAKLFLHELGLTDAEYFEIEYKNSKSIKGLLTDGLLLWKSKLGSRATHDLLLNKLKTGRHARAADWVAQQLKSNA